MKTIYFLFGTHRKIGGFSGVPMLGSIRICVSVVFCAFLSMNLMFEYVCCYMLCVCLHVYACSYAATCVWPEFYSESGHGQYKKTVNPFQLTVLQNLTFLLPKSRRLNFRLQMFKKI